MSAARPLARCGDPLRPPDGVVRVTVLPGQPVAGRLAGDGGPAGGPVEDDPGHADAGQAGREAGDERVAAVGHGQGVRAGLGHVCSLPAGLRPGRVACRTSAPTMHRSSRALDPGATPVSTLLDLQQPAADERTGSDRSDRYDMVAVRAWARSRGYPIDETSGVPLTVLRTYRRLHAG